MSKSLVFSTNGEMAVTAEVAFPSKNEGAGQGDATLCSSSSQLAESVVIHHSADFQDCGAYIFVRCTAQITSPPYVMAVPNATDSRDGLRRAKLCRGGEVLSATWFDQPIAYCVDNIGLVCNA